jgi:two-component system OmpR family sensor kinase
MFASIRTRLWFTYAIIIGVVLLTLFTAILIYLIRNPFVLRQDVQRLKIITTLVVQRSSDISVMDTSEIEDAVLRADQAFDVRILILDSNGILLADSRQSTEGKFPSFVVLNKPKITNSNVIRDSKGKFWIFSIKTLQDGSRVIAASLRPRVSIISLLKDELLGPFFQAAVVTLIVSLLLSFWIAQWLTSPLQRIEVAATRLTRGDYEKIHPEGPGEIQKLTRVFNAMVDKLQASQQAQRDLVANVSHELKTPLTSIQGFAQAIIDNTVTTDEDRIHAAQVIYSEAGRMNRLVINLLDLTKLDSGLTEFHFSKVDISNLLSEIVERFQPAAQRKKILLNVELQKQIIIDCDGDRIAQVFNNLMDNALKYTPDGGEVEVRASQSNDRIELSFADSGPGIPAEDVERIFERFYQVDKARTGEPSKGVGLGLTIAREIILRHHGTIKASNRINNSGTLHGSTFLIILPIIQPDLTS